MSRVTQDKEEILLIQAQAGDAKAYKALYQLHIRNLTAVCSRYVVNREDVMVVLQESFVKIFSSLKSFRYSGPGSFRAWMHRIIVNDSLNFIRAKGKIRFAEISESELEIEDESPEFSNVPTTVIYEFIRELPDGYRTIFNLYAIEGYSHKEIARKLGIKESTSASQFHRARILLSSKIKHYQSNTL